MALQSDTQGFITGGTPVTDIRRTTDLLSAIRSDVLAIKNAVVRGVNRTASQQNNASVIPFPAQRTRQTVVAVTPNRRESASTPSRARDEHGRYASSPVATPSRERVVSQPGNTSIDNSTLSNQIQANTAALSTIPSTDIVRRNNQAAVTPTRGRNGRFTANGRGADTEQSNSNGGNGFGRSSERTLFNGLGDRIASAISETSNGLEDVDPTARAFSEIAQPLARTWQVLAGGNSGDTKWFRRIFSILQITRTENTTYNRAANRSLHNLENQPDSSNGDSGVGMLGFIGLFIAAMFTKLFDKLPTFIKDAMKSFLPASMTRGLGATGRAAEAGVAGAGTAAAAAVRGVPGAAPAVGGMAKIGKFLKKVPILGALLTGYGMYSDIQDSEANPELSRRQKDISGGTAIGGGLGGLAGASAGAAMGSLAGPIGTILGAFAGYFGGSKIGDVIGAKVGELFGDFRGSEMQKRILETWDANMVFFKAAWDGLKSTTDKLSAWASEAYDTIKKKAVEIAAPIIEQAKENAGLLNESIKKSTGFDIKEDLSLAGQEIAKYYGKGKAKAGEVKDVLVEDWKLAKESAVGKSASGETGVSKEDALMFFMEKGWSKEQSAGLVSNLLQESNLNPKSVGDGGKAAGIAQWHPDRQAAFEKQYGKPLKGSSGREQLEFVHHELTAGNEQGAGNKLKDATTAKEAGSVVSKYYERPKLKDQEAEYRGANAENILKSLKSIDASFAMPTVAASNITPGPRVPTFAKPVPISDMPAIAAPLSSSTDRQSISVSVDKQDVGQNLSDRAISHISLGGIGSLGGW